MRNVILPLLIPVVLMLLVASGCGQRTVQEKPADKPPQTAAVPLPEWAPANPSPEFLRAARVLKPIPREILVNYAEGDKAKEAEIQRCLGTWPAHYEFFGTLTDKQIQQFLSKKQIRIPIRSLTPKQRAAMESFFSEWRLAMKGTEQPDFLVFLYKRGAKEDFSNVEAGFDAHGGVIVHIKFWISLSGGEVNEPCNAFACM